MKILIRKSQKWTVQKSSLNIFDKKMIQAEYYSIDYIYRIN